jgi:hypothetical protein
MLFARYRRLTIGSLNEQVIDGSDLQEAIQIGLDQPNAFTLPRSWISMEAALAMPSWTSRARAIALGA